MTNLPSSWVLCDLGEVLAAVEMTNKNEPDREIWYVDISSVDNQTNKITDPKRLWLSEAPSRARQKVIVGDVLFSTVRPYLRKIAFIEPKFDGEIASTGFAVLRGAQGIEPKYLFYKTISHDFVSALTGEQYGVSYPAVKEEQVKSQHLELAPTNEQRRIVEKIEALFDEIDKGVECLHTARTTLGLYRQSLLKSAFEGRLTADWRAKNADKLEDPETLLARIQTEREARYKAALEDWEDAITQWRADGQKGKKPAKPKRLPELETAYAPFPIPANWLTLSVGSLGRVETGATPPTKSKENFGGDIPFFKPTDLEAGADIREAREFLSEIGVEKSRPFSAGTILVTCIGATIGKTGLAGIDAACNQQINYIEPDPNFEPKFIYYQIISPFFQDQIKDNASSTTLPILNKGKFSLLPTIMCSRAEQTEIVRILASRLEAADALEDEVDAALTRAEALRQSILKKAFSGQLVLQNPEDEPAAVLLERIKAEKVEREEATKHDRKSAPPRKPKLRRPTLTDLIDVLKKEKDWISAAKAAQELGIGDDSSSDDVEEFYRQLKDYVEGGAIEAERRGDEDWLRRAKVEVN